MWRRRLPRSTKVFLALAIVCGTAAFAIVRGYAAKLEALRPAVGPPVPVVVAARPVTRGAILAEDDLEVASAPEAFVPSVAVGTLDEVAGRITLTDLAVGEVVTSTRLAGDRTGPISALVPPGLRAVAVSVTAGIDGLVAGDRVDVIATYGGDRAYAETVGEALEVLRAPGGAEADDPFAGAGGRGAALVLLVDPDTAEQLARASAFAALSIAVVGPDPEGSSTTWSSQTPAPSPSGTASVSPPGG
jgi:pilus assembly protein CpaB